MSVLISALLVAALAQAGEDECQACCRAGGLSGCRGSLRLYGEGSLATPEAGAWRILGLWTLACDGRARFESGATAVVPAMPVAGELLLAATPQIAFHCFTQACSFPDSACLKREAQDRMRLVDCRDGAPMPAVQLAQPGPVPPGSDAIIAVVDDTPLVVVPADAGAARRIPDPAAAAPGSCCGSEARGLFGQAVGPPARTAVITFGGGEPQPRSAPSNTPASGPGLSQPRRYVLDVPGAPLSDACGVAEALAAESRRRDEAGNEAQLAGEFQRAIDEYRAALTLDPCNAYAWADLGSVALQVDMASEAAVALAQAVELQARHYTAFTNLGLAYEALGQPLLARQAFLAALGLRPHHPPAEEGLERLGGAP